MSARFWPRISLALPRLALAALLLCLGSGLVLTLQYHPFGDVFASVERLTSRAPYGFFLRRLHDVSGQAFVILVLLHAFEHVLRHGEMRMPLNEWQRVVPGVFLCLLLLFTGFVLKADKEGRFAGAIMGQLLERVPLVGAPLANLFIGQGQAFFFPAYLWHCWLLPLLGLWLLFRHVSVWIPERTYMLWAGAGLTLYALAVPLAPAIPPDALVDNVLGPWFFLGLQELLHQLPAAFAGLLLPALFVLLLLILPRLPHGVRNGTRLLLALSLVAYTVLSFGPLAR